MAQARRTPLGRHAAPPLTGGRIGQQARRPERLVHQVHADSLNPESCGAPDAIQVADRWQRLRSGGRMTVSGSWPAACGCPAARAGRPAPRLGGQAAPGEGRPGAPVPGTALHEPRSRAAGRSAPSQRTYAGGSEYQHGVRAEYASERPTRRKAATSASAWSAFRRPPCSAITTVNHSGETASQRIAHPAEKCILITGCKYNRLPDASALIRSRARSGRKMRRQGRPRQSQHQRLSRCQSMHQRDSRLSSRH
jgi:hypothetical protein